MFSSLMVSWGYMSYVENMPRLPFDDFSRAVTHCTGVSSQIESFMCSVFIRMDVLHSFRIWCGMCGPDCLRFWVSNGKCLGGDSLLPWVLTVRSWCLCFQYVPLKLFIMRWVHMSALTALKKPECFTLYSDLSTAPERRGNLAWIILLASSCVLIQGLCRIMEILHILYTFLH
jgi:hypothetical protein